MRKEESDSELLDYLEQLKPQPAFVGVDPFIYDSDKGVWEWRYYWGEQMELFGLPEKRYPFVENSSYGKVNRHVPKSLRGILP